MNHSVSCNSRSHDPHSNYQKVSRVSFTLLLLPLFVSLHLLSYFFCSCLDLTQFPSQTLSSNNGGFASLWCKQVRNVRKWKKDMGNEQLFSYILVNAACLAANLRRFKGNSTMSTELQLLFSHFLVHIACLTTAGVQYIYIYIKHTHTETHNHFLKFLSLLLTNILG